MKPAFSAYEFCRRLFVGSFFSVGKSFCFSFFFFCCCSSSPLDGHVLRAFSHQIRITDNRLSFKTVTTNLLTLNSRTRRGYRVLAVSAENMCSCLTHTFDRIMSTNFPFPNTTSATFLWLSPALSTPLKKRMIFFISFEPGKERLLKMNGRTYVIPQMPCQPRK